ncbi:MAG: hypothetical protein RL333_76 [Pseudomonadota bacterium]|jgi:hypothetical protein
MRDALKQFDVLDQGTEIRVHKIYRIGKDFLVSFDVSTPANEPLFMESSSFRYHLYDLDDRVFETGRSFETLECARDGVLSRMSWPFSTPK